MQRQLITSHASECAQLYATVIAHTIQTPSRHATMSRHAALSPRLLHANGADALILYQQAKRARPSTMQRTQRAAACAVSPAPGDEMFAVMVAIMPNVLIRSRM